MMMKFVEINEKEAHKMQFPDNSGRYGSSDSPSDGSYTTTTPTQSP